MKKQTRFLAFAICLALICAMLPAMTLTTHAATKSNACGDTLSWSYDEETGALSIEGSGTMYDYYAELAPWSDVAAEIKTVALPEGLTGIGYGAFSGCSALTTVCIPDSVVAIGDWAFGNCSALESVNVPAAVSAIEKDSFAACTAMTAINVAAENPNYSSLDGVLFNKEQTALIRYPCGKPGFYEIPDGVTTLTDNAAFCWSVGLTGVKLPESLRQISGFAFADCPNLTDVILPEGLESIDCYAFNCCTKLRNVNFPESLKWIGMGCFVGCESLTEIVLPDGMVSIGDFGFGGCSNLTKIHLPKSLEGISYGAFNNCVSLRSISLPEGAESIGIAAFKDCKALTGIYVPASVTKIASDAFGSGKGKLNKTLVIYGKTGTEAERFAKEQSFRFVCVDCFEDVKEGDANYAPVVWALVNGITSGKDAAHFAPEACVKRSEAMLFFYAANGRPAHGDMQSPFKDVKKKNWYYDAVLWAVENKITSGTDATHFSPNKTCVRSEILQFLYAAEGKPAYSISNPYADVKGKHWYSDGAIWAYENGLEKGSNGKFQAKTPCTRASVVNYLYRFVTENGLAA